MGTEIGCLVPDGDAVSPVVVYGQDARFLDVE